MIRRRLHITGTVQGVGFRPFLWRLAHRLGLAGRVENAADGVVVEVQGTDEAVAGFITGLHGEAPTLAAIDDVVVTVVAVTRESGFVIEPAGPADRAAAGRETGMQATVPPDVATCDACLAELWDPADRRHRHPFNTCTDCGPRYTMLLGLPYDRPRTTMRTFPMCATCAAEYADPGGRRFHAQSIACPECGPTVWFSAVRGGSGMSADPEQALCRGEAAIAEARRLLRAGGIVAIKGIGGFHLACDATSAAAVGRLRERKGRMGKPLAVMVADLETARRHGCPTPREERLLAGRDRPIVLVAKRPDADPLAAEVSPGNDFVGLMLPYAPLHHLVCAGMPPLVMTSGNLAEEPIVHDNRAAVTRLGRLADGFLLHDREIATACDDSVFRSAAGVVIPIRRSRGHTPLPVRFAREGRTVLAVGGELKASLCLARDGWAIMGEHLGDVANIETVAALGRSAEHLLGLMHAVPEAVACDAHPGSLSARWARDFAAARGVPVVAVQHHEAHVASLLADHGGFARPAIVACFDGTGFGSDGTIWGGEFFVTGDHADFRPSAISRAAHLVPFPLPGADAAILHPWRTALAVLDAAGCPWRAGLPPVDAASIEQRRVLARQIERRINCPSTSSMGRLFDAVAAIAGVSQSITYEAEAAMRLEALASNAGDGPAYRFGVGGGAGVPDATEAAATGAGGAAAGGPLVIDWRGPVAAAARDARDGLPAAAIAGRFHRGVARMIVETCRRLREATGIMVVGLTGGVFQNAVLVTLAVDALHAAGFEVLLHEQVPANDGGLALGQAAIAARLAGLDMSAGSFDAA